MALLSVLLSGVHDSRDPSVLLSGVHDSSDPSGLSGLRDTNDLVFRKFFQESVTCCLVFLGCMTQVTVLSVHLSGLRDSGKPSVRGLQAGLEHQRRSLHQGVCRL